MQIHPAIQVVGPVQPDPPHWPVARGPMEDVVLVVVVVVVVLIVAVVELLVVEPLPPLYPLMIWLTWLTMAAICTPVRISHDL